LITEVQWKSTFLKNFYIFSEVSVANGMGSLERFLADSMAEALNPTAGIKQAAARVVDLRRDWMHSKSAPQCSVPRNGDGLPDRYCLVSV
jgi:hypothetical protein